MTIIIYTWISRLIIVDSFANLIFLFRYACKNEELRFAINFSMKE